MALEMGLFKENANGNFARSAPIEKINCAPFVLPLNFTLDTVCCVKHILFKVMFSLTL